VTYETEIPVVSIVGKSDSGKTTFLEKLIRSLTERGWRVATAKHHVHDFDIDVPGKDSWRHAHAGAVATMVVSPAQFALMRDVDREYTLEELAHQAAEAGADILLTEGFKRVARVRVEVSRAERSAELISSPDELLAVVTDVDHALAGVPLFGLDDAEGVAELVEREFLRGKGARPARDRDSTGSAEAEAVVEGGVSGGD
jgi:molybdopterin-guanine dinucleotide biosynthesis protein B